MLVLGCLMIVSGAAIVVWVSLQIIVFLSTAAFHPDAVPRFDTFIVPIPSKETFDNGLFYFNGVFGTLAWMAEVVLAAALIVVGWRMISTERRLRAEDKQAIDRIKQSQQAPTE
jgi:hypothetical protein